MEPFIGGVVMPTRSIQSLLKWFGEAGVPRFDLAIQRRDRIGNAGAFLAPCSTRAEDLDPVQVEIRLAWLRAENAQGSDIYFRPFRHQAWPMVFLDDLKPSLALKIAGKYRAAVLETSLGSCHLWLALASPLKEMDRTKVQRDLVIRLQGAADPGSISGDHWGRLPGFRNRKPGRNCWVNLLSLTDSRPYHPNPPPHLFTQGGPVVHPVRKRRQDDLDNSRLEWGWVCGCLENGIPASDVLQQLIERARRRRGDQDAIRYARYTVKKACRNKGIPEP
jgi:hypothetical protein